MVVLLGPCPEVENGRTAHCVLCLLYCLSLQLKTLLEGPFKTLECFKREQGKREAEVRGRWRQQMLTTGQLVQRQGV